MKKLIFLSLLCLVAACNESEPTTENTTNQTTDQDSTTQEIQEETRTPEDPKFNHLAMFLAGKEGAADSDLKELERKSLWQNYKQRLDEIWAKTNEKLPTMKTWSEDELGDINEGGGTLFYPFSGPDFLHADVFFPEHEHILMIGLEPIGTYPDMKKKSTEGKDELYLNGVRKSMHAILGMSFFRTIAMAKDFNGEVDGTLPVLMQFMNRTGHKVLYQEPVGVTADGKLLPVSENMPDSTYVGNRFYFQREGSEMVRTLTYFAVNLQNSPYVSRGGLVANGLEQRTDFVAYLKSLNIKSTYLKSASYLMHRPTFSIVRNIILDQSTHVLQDDSGIPVKYFDQGKWNLTFYGNYSFPISLFAERHQPDLKEIYQNKENVRNLPFGIGYQYKKGTSNLMRATRK